MLYYLVVYRKNNNEFIHRVISTLNCEIGEYNGYGWYVLDIQVFYNGRFYKLDEFDSLFDKEIERFNNKRLKKKKYINPFSKSLKKLSEKIDNVSNFIDKL